MMGEIIDRKRKEMELHDHLRGDLVDDQRFQANKKFYSICQSNRDFVKRWVLQRCKKKRVLDYCCGNGDFTIWLAENEVDAYGIDISPLSVENAKKSANQKGLGDKVKFQVMDAEATDFPSRYFDFAVINGVLHHLDLKKAYRELSRILRTDGEAICTEALKHNMIIHLYRKMTPHLRSAWETEHILGKEDIEVAAHYFDNVEVLEFFHLLTIGAVPFRDLFIFEAIRRRLKALDSVILRLPLLKWQAWMVVFVLSNPKNQM